MVFDRLFLWIFSVVSMVGTCVRLPPYASITLSLQAILLKAPSLLNPEKPLDLMASGMKVDNSLPPYIAR